MNASKSFLVIILVLGIWALLGDSARGEEAYVAKEDEEIYGIE